MLGEFEIYFLSIFCSRLSLFDIFLAWYHPVLFFLEVVFWKVDGSGCQAPFLQPLIKIRDHFIFNRGGRSSNNPNRQIRASQKHQRTIPCKMRMKSLRSQISQPHPPQTCNGLSHSHLLASLILHGRVQTIYP